MSTLMPENPVELKINGLKRTLKMRVHAVGDQMISTRLRQEGCWEAYETALTLKHLRAGETYVDVGANIGYFTVLAAQCVGPSGQVFAYEPDPQNFSLLSANMSLNGFAHVQCFPFAIHNANAEGCLHLSEDNFGDHRVYAAGQGRSRRSIVMVHGDAHLGQYTAHVDFLKIDTQGAEYFVVQGLQNTLQRNRDHLRILMEFCPYGIRHSGADGHELVRLLDDLAMACHIVDHQQQCLIPAQSCHLSEWVSRMADEPANEGFVNLLFTPPAYSLDP